MQGPHTHARTHAPYPVYKTEMTSRVERSPFCHFCGSSKVLPQILLADTPRGNWKPPPNSPQPALEMRIAPTHFHLVLSFCTAPVARVHRDESAAEQPPQPASGLRSSSHPCPHTTYSRSTSPRAAQRVLSGQPCSFFSNKAAFCPSVQSPQGPFPSC